MKDKEKVNKYIETLLSSFNGSFVKMKKENINIDSEIKTIKLPKINDEIGRFENEDLSFSNVKITFGGDFVEKRKENIYESNTTMTEVLETYLESIEEENLVSYLVKLERLRNL